MKSYTIAEIAKHNHKDDIWLIIQGKVYDVTKFLYMHPGGDDLLLNLAGKDATIEFQSVIHSNIADAMLEEMYIGEIIN